MLAKHRINPPTFELPPITATHCLHLSLSLSMLALWGRRATTPGSKSHPKTTRGGWQEMLGVAGEPPQMWSGWLTCHPMGQGWLHATPTEPMERETLRQWATAAGGHKWLKCLCREIIWYFVLTLIFYSKLRCQVLSDRKNPYFLPWPYWIS